MRVKPNKVDPNNFENVCSLPNGCTLFRMPNEAGGYTYLSDEIAGGTLVWDTALVDESTLLAAMVEERRRLRGKNPLSWEKVEKGSRHAPKR